MASLLRALLLLLLAGVALSSASSTGHQGLRAGAAGTEPGSAYYDEASQGRGRVHRRQTRALSLTDPNDLTSVMTQVLADGTRARDASTQETISAVLATLAIKSLGRHEDVLQGAMASSEQPDLTELAVEAMKKAEESVSANPKQDPEAVARPQPSQESLKLMAEATWALASLAEASRVSVVQAVTSRTGGVEESLGAKAKVGGAGQKNAEATAGTAAAAAAAAGGDKGTSQSQATGQTLVSLLTGRGSSGTAQQKQAPHAGPQAKQEPTKPAESAKSKEAAEVLAAMARGDEYVRSGRWAKARRSAKKGSAAAALPAVVQEESRPRWVPQEGKYVLLFCAFGRMSNQMSCFRKTLQLAALLNRTLLVPPSNVVLFHGSVEEQYPMGVPVDWERMARCLAPASGPHAIMTFDDYFAKHGRKVVVNRFHCAVPGAPSICVHPLRLQAMAKALGPALQLPPLSRYPQQMVPSPLQPGVPASDDEVIAAFAGVKDSVLCAGGMFQMLYQVPQSRFSLPRSQQCNNLWRPHKAIDRFVDGVIAKKLGPKFAALHLRRGDFYLEHKKAQSEKRKDSAYASYSPIVDVAQMVGKQLRGARVKVLYVATDASNIELQLFKSVLQDAFPVKKVVVLREVVGDKGWVARQPWAKEALALARSSATRIPWVLADKGICARASLFLGTPSSSFTEDIMQMRCDERSFRGLDESSIRCLPNKGCSAYFC